MGSVLSLIVEYLVTRRKTLSNTVAAGFSAKCKVRCVQLGYQNSCHIPKFPSTLLCPGSAGRKAGRGRALGRHTTEEPRRVLIITNVFISAPHHSLDKQSALSLKESQIRGMTRNRNNTKDSNLKQAYIL